MATTSSCKESVAVRIMLTVQILLAVFTFVMWSRPTSPGPYKVLGDIVTVQCRNLLPERAAVVMNGVYMPPGAVRSVPISRTKLNITIQLVVTGKPLNQALNVMYTVPVSPKLVNLHRILFALELTRRCESCAMRTSCEGCERGSLCLQTPLGPLLGYFGFLECPPPKAPISSRSSDVRIVPPVLVSPDTASHSEAPFLSDPPEIVKQVAF
ncbi:hypothetical protein KC19_10G030900 [Ceratodon purpureus]|uniref:Uncharacterized protein n=1 Tax=Ceratodon purpureus TaxID=3225 RepID=A0A8T0GHG7_CERPU|nr:hypothetical protein KC19_10G030900 [Ceratodon purpureus]